MRVPHDVITFGGDEAIPLDRALSSALTPNLTTLSDLPQTSFRALSVCAAPTHRKWTPEAVDMHKGTETVVELQRRGFHKPGSANTKRRRMRECKRSILPTGDKYTTKYSFMGELIFY